MKKVLYACGDALVNGVARLPLRVLYILADFIFFILYHLVRYRRKVTLKNLRDSFPDYDEKQIAGICRQFYRNFSDYIVETLKLAHISDDEMAKRMEFENIEIMDKPLGEGRSVVIYFSHCFNWEWAPSVILHSRHRNNAKVVFGQVYRPLDSKWFDSVMLRLRGRFGAESYKKKNVLRDLLTLRRDGIAWCVGFMSDQKPSHGDPTYVMKFLNHPTAAITGTETLATRLKTAVIYWDMHKTSRGHYKIAMRHIADDASTHPQHEITDRYMHMLEDTIHRQPDLWLWTHKRWKNPVTLPQE